MENLTSIIKKSYPEKSRKLCLSHLCNLLDLSDDKLERFSSNEIANKWEKSITKNLRKTKSLLETNTNVDYLFGQELTSSRVDRLLPFFEYLSKPECLELEGIFRKSGSKFRQNMMRYCLNNGDSFTEIINKEIDGKNGQYKPHDIACLLKLFFMELPQPLIPLNHLEAYSQAIDLSTDENKLQALQILTYLLPDPNWKLLKLLITLLGFVIEFQNNKMNEESLSTILAHHLFLPRMTNVNDIMKKSTQINTIFIFMLNNRDKLFHLPNIILSNKTLQPLEDNSYTNINQINVISTRISRRESISRKNDADDDIIEPNLCFVDREVSFKCAESFNTSTAMDALLLTEEMADRLNYKNARNETPKIKKRSRSLTNSLTNSIRKLQHNLNKKYEVNKLNEEFIVANNNTNDKLSWNQDNILSQKIPVIKQINDSSTALASNKLLKNKAMKSMQLNTFSKFPINFKKQNDSISRSTEVLDNINTTDATTNDIISSFSKIRQPINSSNTGLYQKENKSKNEDEVNERIIDFNMYKTPDKQEVRQSRKLERSRDSAIKTFFRQFKSSDNLERRSFHYLRERGDGEGIDYFKDSMQVGVDYNGEKIFISPSTSHEFIPIKF